MFGELELPQIIRQTPLDKLVTFNTLTWRCRARFTIVASRTLDHDG